MNDLNQLILNFDYDQNFKDQDFYVSKSNEFAFKLLNSWPKWEKNFVNLIGEKFSGKTHLINIFLEKFKGIKIEADEINNEFFKKIKVFENIIIENLNDKIDENLYNHYDYIFLFNNRLTSSSKKIYSLVSLLESEEYIKKKDLNKLINNFSYNTINENSYLFRKNQTFNFILNFIFTEKNIFMTNFYFKFYQYIVFEKVKKKLTLGNNFEIRLEDKDLISFFKCETKTPNKLFRIKFFDE